MIQLFLPVIKNLIQEIVKQYGAGEQIFKMILLHACSGQPKKFNECNHPPMPMLAHSNHLTVQSGELFYLSAAGSIDPDGDSMSYLWFQYAEAGTYKGIVSLRPYAPNLYRIPVTAPVVDSTQTIHFILKVTDKGTPPITRYKRVIVTVVPK
jgi:hypothetical protein